MIHTFKGNSSIEDFCSQDDIDIKEVIFFYFRLSKMMWVFGTDMMNAIKIKRGEGGPCMGKSSRIHCVQSHLCLGKL